jgi:hypothetical protein
MSKRRRATTAKRPPSKPKYAFGCVCEADETWAPDLRAIPLDERNTAYIRLKLPLVEGCAVLGFTHGGPKVGRYFCGPPERFAEFVDLWEGARTKDAKVRRKTALSSVLPARVVGLCENLLASERRAKGK